MNGVKIELAPHEPKNNQRVCEHCDGIGWLYDFENKFMEKCNKCYNGLIDTCPKCGNDIRGFCNNDKCWEGREIEREERLFNSAKRRITYKEAVEDGMKMFYSEAYPYNNGYFSDISDLEDCLDEDVEMPKYVWGTTEVALSIDAESVVENACDELHEEAFYNIEGIDELQDFINEWCEKQTGVDTYWQDSNCVVML